MNGFDTRVIDKNERPPIEIENFIHQFVGLFYSYTTSNYEKHMNRAAHLFEIGLLRNFSDKVNKMAHKVAQSPTVQNSYVQKIYKIKDYDYEIEMDVRRSVLGVEERNNYRVRLQIERIQRSVENPYGLRLVKLREIYE